jgi:hypothetical protein
MTKLFKITRVPAKSGRGSELEIRQRVGESWVPMPGPRSATHVEAIALRNAFQNAVRG